MLIKNIKIITPDEVLKGYGVLIKEGIISNIDLEEKLSGENHELINGQGNYLSPGFIDIHNHGNSGFDIMESTQEALEEISKYHIKNGVTSYLASILSAPYDGILKAIENILTYKNRDDRANLIGIHLEGPFFNKEKKGAQPQEHIKEADLKMMKEILKASKNKMKMVSLAPELPGAFEIIRYLKENNIRVAMAHTNATFEEGKLAIECGARVATHLFNGMRNFNHRQPGIVGAALTDDRVYCEIIYDRVHLHDGTVDLTLKAKGYDKTILVSDAIRAAGLTDGVYELGGQMVKVKNGVARLGTGTLAGSTLNLRTAVYNMVKYLDVPIHQAVKMASLNPAKAINIDDKLGSIEIGKKANLILFDRDINIKKRIINGKEI